MVESDRSGFGPAVAGEARPDQRVTASRRRFWHMPGFLMMGTAFVLPMPLHFAIHTVTVGRGKRLPLPAGTGCAEGVPFRMETGGKKERSCSFRCKNVLCGGRNRTRTCDPIDVNDVLYQLSHATELASPVAATKVILA